jgi:hypothetical protein
MRSIRKITLLAAAVAAVVAVSAPAANAATGLVESKGYLVPPWTLLSMTSTNLTYKTSWGNLSCWQVTLPGKVSTNTYTVVEANYPTLGSSEGCFMGGTKSFTLEPELRGMHLEGPTAGTMNLKFKAKFPNNINCVYESTAAPVTYTSGNSVLQLTNASMTAIPAACGPFYVSGGLTISSPSYGGGLLFLK